MYSQRTAKELIRNLIARSGLTCLHLKIRKAMGQNIDHLSFATLEDRFSAIYRNRIWLNGRSSGSLSGLGSEFESTASVRSQLPEVLKSLGTRAILDLGCGDFTWMRETCLPCSYIGIDIVRETIDTNTALYAAEGRSFVAMDATREELPEADTILCREVLFHLSFHDIWRLIENVRHSSASVLIATSDNGLRLNADIRSGDFRMLNLCAAPFSFPPPELTIPDNSVAPDRILAVWRIAVLPIPQSHCIRWSHVC